MKPIVAIIGRPNTGKSTLFNRMTRTRDAIVDDMPGVTRDRKYGDAVWNEKPFTVVDTGGFVEGDPDDFAEQIRLQVRQALADADAVVLLFDGKAGILPFDRDLVEMVRDYSKPVIYAVNKIDGQGRETDLYEFYSLGVSPLYPVSAEHGYGMADFLDALTGELAETPVEEPAENAPIRLAIVGRPNAGKSSLLNRIVGQSRSVVSDTPGTTRDTVDTPCRVGGRDYLLIDTAGIRRKSKVSQRLEKFSIIKALKSMERCDVALVVLDASEGITDQDVKIIGYAYERGCGMILLLNKWDLVDKERVSVRQMTRDLQHAAKFTGFAPVLTISALTGQRVNRIFDLVRDVYSQYTTRINTGRLNQIITAATERTAPSLYKGRRIKFYYATQVKTRPPTFVCFVNFPKAVHFSYRRYLVNQIREETGLDRTPVRMYFRKREGDRRKK